MTRPYAGTWQKNHGAAGNAVGSLLYNLREFLAYLS